MAKTGFAALLVFLSTFTYANENSISVAEAKSFLEVKMRESFPTQQVVLHEKAIAFKSIEGTQSICYSNECWPVIKREAGLTDLAAQTAKELGRVRVEFRYTAKDPNTPKTMLIQRPSFALESENTIHVADILRFLNGYRQYSPYHIKFAPKEGVLNDKTWIKAEYFSQGRWIESAEIRVKYENVQFLEEVFDGQPELLLALSADELRKHPFFKDGHAILSPWAIFPTSIAKDGAERANLINKFVLPPGPFKDRIKWKHATQ
jgi:hypothetical protein